MNIYTHLSRPIKVVAGMAIFVLAASGIAVAVTPPNPTPSSYVAIAPHTYVSQQSMAAGHNVWVTIAGTGKPIPSSATAVQLTVTVANGTTAGNLYLRPAGGSPTSVVQWSAGEGVTTTVTVPIGAAGQIVADNSTGQVAMSLVATAYYTGSLVAGSIPAADLSTTGSASGQVLTSTDSGVQWEQPQVTYTTSPTSAQWQWNGSYSFDNTSSEYTSWFTRYVDVPVAALTSSVLANGSVQVYFTPSPLSQPASWQPLPFQFFDSFNGVTYNVAYVVSAGQVELEYFFTYPSGVTPPDLSTYPIQTYAFKIVVTPNTGGTPIPELAHPATARRAGQKVVCKPFPGGRRCVAS